MSEQTSATLPARPSALPDAWIAKIFDHMSGLYGSQFADKWANSNIDSVRSLWAAKLAGFRDMPESIKEALDALDNKPYPPSLPEFLELCRDAARRRGERIKAIEHKPTLEELEKARMTAQKVANAAANFGNREPRKWIDDLKKRKEAGEILSALQERWIIEAECAPVGA